MSRTRMYGTFAAVVACAGLVAGCGGGEGYTAAEAAPTSTAPAPAAAAPAAAPPATPGPLGAFAQSDPVTGRDETFASYQRFPKTRAGKIFVDPNEPPPAPVVPVADPGAAGAVTTVPLNPTAPTGSTVAALPTPVPVTTQLSASLDISGVVQTVVVGDQVPASAPQFTVQSITSTMVTLKPTSGSLPGGSATLDLAVGKAVTLSNPSTKTNLVINVVEIKSQV